jgi:hypothetical protein
MPKERIKHGQIYLQTPSQATDGVPDMESPMDARVWEPGSDIPIGGTLHEQPSLDIHWNKDGQWVQLGFEAPREWWDNFIASYAGSEEQHTFAAFTDVMSRAEINALIRGLRRARDASYGADA